MSFYRWRTVVGPILFGLQGVMVLRTLRIDHTQYTGQAIPVPLFRGAQPVFVAIDSALPAGYDMVHDYNTGLLTIYRWNSTSNEWQVANSIPETLNLRVLFIYETVHAS